MIKDLEKGTCSVKHDGTRRTSPLFKCRKTGLLLIHLSLGLHTLHEHANPDEPIPAQNKWLRVFRTPFHPVAAMASACASGTGDGPTNMLALISLNGTCGPPDISSQENCLTILSAGESSVIPEAHGKHVVDISVRDFGPRSWTVYRPCGPSSTYIGRVT